ncbi:hypothetical protein AV530_013391 [Patagioenas fasciata monilis]|uniref:Uncharacterized protein n=1 Tax=Patagioenas fasciata monilis TaxID=372326 RepID=A0A1V4JP83_PATFA|nr:hypothetical protein AV530_013391 [Patagioenas fasciata monilis]
MVVGGPTSRVLATVSSAESDQPSQCLEIWGGPGPQQDLMAGVHWTYTQALPWYAAVWKPVLAALERSSCYGRVLSNPYEP